jgi:hypothetical protein
MGKPKAPAPPDPKQTAGAQTSQNIGTAIAQQQLNNVNQVTPDGSLTYNQSGNHAYTDPNTGQVHNIPTYTATQTLSAGQQKIHDQKQQSSLNLATLGSNQSGRLDDLLSRPMDMAGLPDRGDPSSIQGPNLERFGSGPNMQTSVGNAGNVQREIQGAGGVQRNIGSAGNIQNGIAGAGNVQRGIGDAGQVTRSYGTDFSTDRQRVEDTLMERMNPSLDRDRSAMETRLASQGIRMGSEAYNSAMSDLGRQSNDARMSAILNAGQEQSRLTGLEAQRAGFENSAQQQSYNQQAGRASFANQAQNQQFGQNSQQAQFGNTAQQQGFNQQAQRAGFSNQAQNQQFGQNAQQAQFGNAAQGQDFQQLMARAGFGNQANQQMHENQAGAKQANNQSALQEFGSEMSLLNAQNSSRNQAMQEQFALRNQPINEITALMSGAQVQNPNFVNPNSAKLANTDVAGITMGAHKAAQQNYQSKMSNWNNMMGGIGSLFSLSDRRTKTDIKKVGKTDDGQNVYKYRYKAGGPMQMGLMAQEVEKKKPKAVAEVNGLKMVNYGEALS